MPEHVQTEVTEVREHRFQPYLEELREFLASRGVSAGKPADIAAFAHLLAEGAPLELEEEMGAILRSIVYRENERMGRGELLEMLTSALGGPGVDGVAPGMQANVRTIFLFLNKALRQQRPSYVPERVAPRPVAEEAFPVSGPERAEVLPSTPAVTAAHSQEHSAPPPVAAMPGPGAETSRELSQAEATSTAAPVIRQRPEPPGSSGRPDVVSTPAARSPASPHPFSPWVAAAELKERPQQGPAVLPGPVPEFAQERSAPEGDKLYRALSLSADSEFDNDFQRDREELERPASTTRWLVPAVAGGLALLGVGAYLGRPFLGGGRRADTTAMAPAATSPLAIACSSPMLAGSSRSGLEERSRWAHNLLDQKLYGSALPELREIARMDPSYPGIRLDESDALLNLKRPEDARAAIDEQISISQCLARLPSPALDGYCALHYPAATRSGCQAQMAHISQQAELQAALVHLELGHRVQPTADAEALSELNGDAEPHARPRRAAGQAATRPRAMAPAPTEP